MRIARRTDIAGSLCVVSRAQLDEAEPVGGTTFKLRG